MSNEQLHCQNPFEMSHFAFVRRIVEMVSSMRHCDASCLDHAEGAVENFRYTSDNNNCFRTVDIQTTGNRCNILNKIVENQQS